MGYSDAELFRYTNEDVSALAEKALSVLYKFQVYEEELREINKNITHEVKGTVVSEFDQSVVQKMC